MKKKRLLIVDDDPSIILSMKIWLEGKGFEVFTARNSKEALRLLEKKDFLVALVDYRLTESTGIELSEKMLMLDPELKIIILTGFPSYDIAVKAMKEGVFNYISKSESNEEILESINKAIMEQEKKLKSEVEKKRIKYVLLCHHSLIKERLRNMEDDEFDFKMVRNFPLYEGFLEESVDLKFDVILLCHSCNVKDFKDYYKIIPEFRKNFEDSKIIVFNGQFNDEEKIRLVRMGVKGIFGKDVSSEELKKGIKKIYEGDLWVSRKIIGKALESNEFINFLDLKDEKDSGSRLTEREKEVLKLILKGLKNKEIGEKLFISEQTVKTHINNIFKKLGVKNRAQLIVKLLKD